MTLLQSSSASASSGSNLSALGRETRAVSNTAVGLASVPASATAAVVQVEDAAVRMDFEATPTSTQGYQLFAGDSIEIHTKSDLDSVQFIRVTGTDASLEVLYFG